MDLEGPTVIVVQAKGTKCLLSDSAYQQEKTVVTTILPNIQIIKLATIEPSLEENGPITENYDVIIESGPTNEKHDIKSYPEGKKSPTEQYNVLDNSGPSNKKPKVQCKYCDSQFVRKGTYYRHCRSIHKIEPEKTRQPRVKCPLCDFMCCTRQEFYIHLENAHNFHIEKLTKTFSTFEEFEQWKALEEQNQFCRYSCNSHGAFKDGKLVSKSWMCHRDGQRKEIVPDALRKRRLKGQGSVKMGSSCPSCIQVKETQDGFVVTYLPHHLGHEPDFEKNYLPLTDEEKRRLAKFGLMRSAWKRRNHEKFQNDPQVKKLRAITKQFATPAALDIDNDCDHAIGVNEEDSTNDQLFDFTSPKQLFQSLIHPLEFKDFFDAYWEQKPLVQHRAITHEQTCQLKQLFSKDTLLQLVKSKDMHFMRDLNALRYKNGKRQDLNDEGRITAAKLTKLFDKDKATVQVHQPQRFQDDLWQIMELLESFFGTLVGANVYITPGDSQGLSPHHDDVEVFIIQLEGEKHWRLYEPVEELPRSYSIDLSENDIGEPTHDLVLKPGDFLYFPRGTIHQADTPKGVSHSTHITFSTYQHNCWGDYMMSVFPQILEEAMKSEVAFRRGLPINFIRSTKLPQTSKVRSVMSLLLQTLAGIELPKFVPPENMIEDFMKSRLPPHLVDGQALRECLPIGKPPDLNSKVRLKYPEHLCFLIRKNPPNPEELEDEEDEENELNHSETISAQVEEESLFVYSSIFNDRKTHMMDAAADDSSGFCLRFPKHYQECLMQLKASGENFTAVASLQLPSDENKENLIRALWTSHVLEVFFKAKGRKSRKSTKT